MGIWDYENNNVRFGGVRPLQQAAGGSYDVVQGGGQIRILSTSNRYRDAHPGGRG